MVDIVTYASDTPIFTGWWALEIFPIENGTVWYANVMSPFLYNETLNVNDPSS